MATRSSLGSFRAALAFSKFRSRSCARARIRSSIVDDVGSLVVLVVVVVAVLLLSRRSVSTRFVFFVSTAEDEVVDSTL
jgi:hypothetical protein